MLGIVNEVKPLQLRKASSLIEVKPSGSVTDVRPTQLIKAAFPM